MIVINFDVRAPLTLQTQPPPNCADQRNCRRYTLGVSKCCCAGYLYYPRLVSSDVNRYGDSSKKGVCLKNIRVCCPLHHADLIGRCYVLDIRHVFQDVEVSYVEK